MKRIVAPFSRVQIARVAGLIKLDEAVVESKLSQMILDGKFSGILDQGSGCLVVYDKQSDDTIYQSAVDTTTWMEKVVDSLHARAAALS